MLIQLLLDKAFEKYDAESFLGNIWWNWPFPTFPGRCWRICISSIGPHQHRQRSLWSSGWRSFITVGSRAIDLSLQLWNPLCEGLYLGKWIHHWWLLNDIIILLRHFILLYHIVQHIHMISYYHRHFRIVTSVQLIIFGEKKSFEGLIIA